MTGSGIAHKPTRLVVVTDPMCSWCWGMAGEVEQARRALAGRVEFDLMLGGINTHGTQPIGDFGRRFLMRLWGEVAATTGQFFGSQLPSAYVHNSVTACLAVEAFRSLSGEAPFAYLHALQARFFQHGVNITEENVLAEIAEQCGVSGVSLRGQLRDPGNVERVRFQFDHARTFGTQALPSLLIEQQGSMRLFAGGFVTADMIATLLGDRGV